jgi:hypothetical protein
MLFTDLFSVTEFPFVHAWPWCVVGCVLCLLFALCGLLGACWLVCDCSFLHIHQHIALSALWTLRSPLSWVWLILICFQSPGRLQPVSEIATCAAPFDAHEAFKHYTLPIVKMIPITLSINLRSAFLPSQVIQNSPLSVARKWLLRRNGRNCVTRD